MSIIENLRGKSNLYKRSVAFSVSFFVTLVIFGVWVTALFPGQVTGGSVLSEKIKPDQPLATLSRNTASAFGAVKDQFSELVKYFNQIDYKNNTAEIMIVSPEEYEAKSASKSASPKR